MSVANASQLAFSALEMLHNRAL